ncbi:putative aureobasidin-resistance protein [Trichodelitschia bisporula]|uniref:Putative aureobasidin-resistance protein n=1 Tax=Trichodelitschia bisporula TaxID=703511 RepID=A0A6G1I3H8_9PEZI|nr:putative aureobasidin-resistance protein [Trichodelitschia bisporula]
MKKTMLPLSLDDYSAAGLSSPRLPSIRQLIPHKVRRKWRATNARLRSGQSPASSITSLTTSFAPADTLKALRSHRWTFYDGQYLLLAVLGIFCLSVMEMPGPLIKTCIATALMLSLTIPITRQFFLPFLPVIGYLVLFYSCKFISGEYRPPIWVTVLPALENIFYGANLSNILSEHKHVVLDVLAWFPYGISHFASPAIVGIVMFIWAPPGTVPTFARAFGYMNMAGVATQLLFPCAPPWYANLYGLAPANYSVKGSPAGLAAIDKLFGVDMYTSTFTASPMVFGAFPSLHSANATIEALFLMHCFPSLAPAFLTYVLWIWWATMYLSHHYAIDLVGGSLFAGVAFFIAKQKFLPRIQPGKKTRWDYDYVEIGESQDTYYTGVGRQRHARAQSVGLYGYEEFHSVVSPDSDEWTIGSSSSVASSRSPSSNARSSAEGSGSWEGETLASGSESERGR